MKPVNSSGRGMLIFTGLMFVVVLIVLVAKIVCTTRCLYGDKDACAAIYGKDR